MKIRNDFVTNSSSSSFILSFKDEESIYDTLEEQFPTDIEECWSAGEEGYLQQLLDEIKDAKRYTKNDVISLIEYESRYMYEWLFRRQLTQCGMSYSEKQEYLNTNEGKEELRKYTEGCIKERIKDAFEKIGDDIVIVEVEHGDGGEGEDGVLENKILPELDCTVVSFSHH